MMYDYDFGHMFGWGFFGGGMMIFFWIVVAVFAVLIVKAMNGREPERKDRSLDILKERYAKGEIDKEEFEVKKKDLAS
jgi:putative membrane protein